LPRAISSSTCRWNAALYLFVVFTLLLLMQSDNLFQDNTDFYVPWKMFFHDT